MDSPAMSPAVEARRAQWRESWRKYIATHGYPRAKPGRRNVSAKERWAQTKLRRYYVTLGIPCQKCGGKDRLQVSHKVPLWMGGSTTRENSEWLCRACHLSHDFLYSRADVRLRSQTQ